MAAETVIILCTRHRRRVIAGQPAKGSGLIILHDPPGSADRQCDSKRFIVRREHEASREAAHAELIALALKAEKRP